MEDWQKLPSEDPDLFLRLRGLGETEICVRFGIGTERGDGVDIPAARLMVEGRLRVEPEVARFGVTVSGWGPSDFAWFARRVGRGGPDYWQGALEYRPEGRPALVLYFTARLDALEISVRTESLSPSRQAAKRDGENS
jgi:hypothetical protein